VKHFYRAAPGSIRLALVDEHVLSTVEDRAVTIVDAQRVVADLVRHSVVPPELGGLELRFRDSNLDPGAPERLDRRPAADDTR
jgi:hypothetical protein